MTDELKTALSKYEFSEYAFFDEDDDMDGLFVNTNDLFYWAVADCERVTAENLPLLLQSIDDMLAVGGDADLGCVLFACRLNGMRPQGACYPENRAVWPLLDAAGPEREVGIGNPCRPGDYR